MSFLTPKNSAEATDSIANLTAAGTALAACYYSINVAEAFVPADMASLLGRVQLAGGILIVGVLAPLLVFLEMRGGRPAGSSSSNGSYLGALFRQASLTAFSLTLLFTIVLSALDRRVLTHISAETAVDLIITVSFALFALSFFVISRFTSLDDGLGDGA